MERWKAEQMAAPMVCCLVACSVSHLVDTRVCLKVVSMADSMDYPQERNWASRLAGQKEHSMVASMARSKVVSMDDCLAVS